MQATRLAMRQERGGELRHTGQHFPHDLAVEAVRFVGDDDVEAFDNEQRKEFKSVGIWLDGNAEWMAYE
ncbi:hypothetical protein E2C01_095253 [Portunus trituberculatus]|uniref:Uncharacterized protein n=1 Tax=Portunus trituberculatus TaxID=210409 RepID=A0A5B7JZP7_PORTR|nr:hypothetical protein [Portunus trituberculatus]